MEIDNPNLDGFIERDIEVCTNLFLIIDKDSGSILCAHIKTLSIESRWIMKHKEMFDKILISSFISIEF